jgi:redox-sensitive bicupin YhaK (pirin superfamily)
MVTPSIDPQGLKVIRAIHAAHREDIGDLVTYQALPVRSRPSDALEPFLFLNHHGPQVYPPGNQGLPFGPHPHRGFETVTFILEGDLVHKDTGGTESRIRAGGVQWMTAGRGLVHAELSSDEFKRTGGPLEILQLWVNLPARLKMTEPGYVGLQKEDIARDSEDHGRVLVDKLPARELTDVRLFVVTMKAGARWHRDVPAGKAVFFYVVRGDVKVNGQRASARHLVEFADDGTAIDVEAGADAVILFGHGTPNHEPVVAHGPFVMNTQQEIVEAVRDYQAGKFGTFN